MMQVSALWITEYRPSDATNIIELSFAFMLLNTTWNSCKNVAEEHGESQPILVVLKCGFP